MLFKKNKSKCLLSGYNRIAEIWIHGARWKPRQISGEWVVKRENGGRNCLFEQFQMALCLRRRPRPSFSFLLVSLISRMFILWWSVSLHFASSVSFTSFDFVLPDSWHISLSVIDLCMSCYCSSVIPTYHAFSGFPGNSINSSFQKYKRCRRYRRHRTYMAYKSRTGIYGI